MTAYVMGPEDLEGQTPLQHSMTCFVEGRRAYDKLENWPKAKVA